MLTDAISRGPHREPKVCGGRESCTVFAEMIESFDSCIEVFGLPSNEEIIFSELKKLAAEGCCIIMAVHKLSVVQQCDEVVYLEDGKIKAIGRPDELQEYFK